MKFSGIRKLFGKGKRLSYKVVVNPNLAFSAVILAYPGKNELELSKILDEVFDKGYDIGYTFKSSAYKPGYYSRELLSFIELLEVIGFCYRSDFSPIELTRNGRNRLEMEVLEHYFRNPFLTERFSKDIGLNLASILKNHKK